MEKDIDINIELRSEILEASLNLENAVNGLIIALLVIEKEKRKAITYRSGNISFKNKIDLLFDLDILDGEEHQKLLLQMELRNQFLHNIECNSFVKAINNLGSDKGKKILKFYNSSEYEDLEFQYRIAFSNLKIECIKIVLAKIENRKKQIDELAKIHVNDAEMHIFLIDKYFDVLKNILEVFETNVSDKPEVIRLFDQVEKAIFSEVNSLQTSEKFIMIQNKFRNWRTPEKIKALFRR
jgi:hypothetical protein